MAVLQGQLVAAVDLELMWVQEREQAYFDALLSCPGMLLGEVVTASTTAQQMQSLEDDDVVAAAAPAVVAMGTAAAACLDEADVGRQGSRGETPEARFPTRA